MKKKAIEKIPYLKLAKTNKRAKYIGVTAVKTISHEKHLLLEVYRNKKGEREIPIVRIVLTKKDFGTYFPEKEEWTRQKIVTNKYYSSTRLIWNKAEEGRDTWEETRKKNILQSDEDLERIKKYCETTAWRQSDWWEYIEKYQDNITTEASRKAEKRRYEKRQQALKDRMEHTRPLPEKEVLERADRMFFSDRHYLYYKKHGCRATVACSKCGGVTDARWKEGTSYESQFERHINEPREGHYGTCPMCGTRGEYK